MLKDEARTVGYREAFKSHSIDFKDKVVMDLGCGTGILSFFAVESGAKLGFYPKIFLVSFIIFE